MDSQATFNTMEVLSTKPIGELTSEAIIKVCYVSDKPNPNKTVISRAIGQQIAETLPGAPVAGLFDKETGDFVEHSRRITFKDGGFNIEDLTKAYGFVDPVASPWYQDFEEEGEIRTYLMCKAYLWTRQYEEASLAFGKGQSMELDEKAMAGYYKADVFVFTDATLEKLCILGDAYAPCFSGAKIMTTYAKQYEDLAEKLEKTLGRRYYVMNDKLIEKTGNEPKAPFALDYALQLGWNLNDAVYLQLANRGAADKYSVEGIYTEGGSVFVILQDRTTLEFVRCDVTITAADTVELGSEMTAVTQTWSVKAPPAPEATEPLNGSSAVPVEGAPAAMPAAPAAAPTYAKKEDEKKEDEEDDAAVDDAKDEEDEGKKKKKAFTAKPAAPAAPATPAVDFSLEIAAKDNKIATLEAELAAFKAATAEKEKVAKDELIASYAKDLTEAEMKPLVEKAATYSLETLEEKFALLYARKARTAPTSQFQVNIAAVGGDDDATLPEFMRQAMEYDKARQISL